MVASGLVGRVDVAQERLSIHLTMACLILIAVVWTARRLAPVTSVASAAVASAIPRRLAWTAVTILSLLVVQIALGGLVAGLKAGFVYNTWPLIDGALIPAREHLFLLAPAWANLIDNHLAVQFTHRMVAYLLVTLAVFHAADCAYHNEGRVSAIALAALLLLQATLGVTALLWHVPMLLALAHQSVAVVTLVTATVHAANLLAGKPRAVAYRDSNGNAMPERLSAA